MTDVGRGPDPHSDPTHGARPRRSDVNETGSRLSSDLGWAFDDIPAALIALDSNGNVDAYNRAAAELIGEAPIGLLKVGGPLMALIGPSARQYVAWRSDPTSRQLRAAVRASGRLIDVVLTKSHIAQRPGWSIVAVQADDDAAVRDAHELAFEYARTAVFVAWTGGDIIAANPAFAELFGSDDRPLVGRNWQHLLLADESPVVTRDLHSALRQEQRWTGRVETMVADVGRRTLDVTVAMRPYTPRDLGGVASARTLVGYVTDVTDDTTVEDALREQATRDALTGLLNRAGFLAELQQRFDEAQRNGTQLTALYVDLDNFKTLNDHYGHRYGDILLEAFAKRLQGSLKSSDLVGRIGGDEFVVLFDPGLTHATLSTVVSKLRHRLLQEYQLDDLSYTCTASFGSADYPWDATTAEEVLEFADHAMYQAKTLGRNRHATFDREEFRGWIDREDLIASIEAGIDAMQFVPYYQPIFDTNSSRVRGAEALVRWVDPDEPETVRLPAEFLPLIETRPASIHLGTRLVDQVLVHMRSWANTTGPVPVSINLSAGQLRSEDMIAHFEEAAERYADEMRHLRVEVVESAFYDGDPVIADNLSRLAALGLTLSLDDFGTGHSSLLSLRAHAFRQVKIDRQFLAAVESGNDADRLVLESMVNLGRQLGLETVCEGVETAEQLAYLRDLGCDLVQGFHLARPMPKKDLRALMRRRSASA